MTRSNEAMPDWKTFIIDATWVSGIENWREYWMNAWMSPSVIAPLANAQTADHRDDHVLHVAHEHRERLHQARHELGAERRLVELVVGLAEPLLDLALAAERLHDRVTGERLLDLGVEEAGVLPLRDELGPRPCARSPACPKTETGTVVSATTASNGEIVNIMIAVPMSRSTDVSIWLSVCCRLCATLSMSLVTRLSRSPR